MTDLERIVDRCLRDVTFDVLRASGPGGQNVNKVATAVQLRFDAAHSPHLDAGALRRLLTQAGKRATASGLIIIQARRHRTQEANRQDALTRLRTLVSRAVVPPKKRLPTRATAASKERRLKTKKRRSEIKRLRRPEAA